MRALLLLAIAAGCETRGVFRAPEASLERMIDQPRVDAYEHSDLFPDHRGMRTPPDGAVPYGRAPLDPKRELGVGGGDYLTEIPLAVDLPLLERGRNRFEIFCATCHGVLADGRTVVAEQMELVKPPALTSERIRGFPPGRIYRAIREGFGVMPSYRVELDDRDRWAVVAYLEALQLAEPVTMTELTPELLREAEEQLR